MSHIITPGAEEVLNKEFPVLNRGFVRLVDYMGGDDRVVAAARVSYGAGTTTKRRDKILIEYLMENRHTSPFEQVELVFHVKLPIFVARQWIRHRTASLNELSGRYSKLEDEFFVPQLEDIRPQSKKNHQARSDEILDPKICQFVIDKLTRGQDLSYQDYETILGKGVAREISRTNLPLSIYTQWYWKIDLHNLFHFLKLRLEIHAQQEFRRYAEIIARIAKIVVPISFKAFEEYQLYAKTFSRREIDILTMLLVGMNITKEDIGQKTLLSKERLNIFCEKLNIK